MINANIPNELINNHSVALELKILIIIVLLFLCYVALRHLWYMYIGKFWLLHLSRKRQNVKTAKIHLEQYLKKNYNEKHHVVPCKFFKSERHCGKPVIRFWEKHWQSHEYFLLLLRNAQDKYSLTS